jgi:hypothetical protein
MLIDGLYSVRFKTPMGEGAGVVSLIGGRLRGGDAGIAYLGSYKHADDNFTATVKTQRHTPGLGSVFGKDSVTISLAGKSSGGSATCTGTAAEAPGVTFQAVLTHISD